MQSGFKKAKRLLMVIYLISVHLVLAYFIGERLVTNFVRITPVEQSSIQQPDELTAIPTPLSVPDEFADVSRANSNANAAILTPASGGLIIPVAGVRPDQLIDTFSQSRSESRFHDAIDIAAPAGTPVLAAADGEIARFHDSDRGGFTIYQLTSDQKFALYYAHLERRSDDIREGMFVKQGTVIGYVGDTGNAGAGNYHLHFSIARISDPKRIWTGTYLNPFPILKSGGYPDVP